MNNAGTSSTPNPDHDPNRGKPIIVPRLIDLSEVEIKPIDWLWENKIPYGDITVIAGLQKQGKSMGGEKTGKTRIRRTKPRACEILSKLGARLAALNLWASVRNRTEISSRGCPNSVIPCS